MIDVADANALYYYHFDGLGSVVALCDVNSVPVERYAYDVFGRPTIRDANGVIIDESAFGNPYLFTGRAYDAETALYYYRARYYDYFTGRFLQPDPMRYKDSLNMYTYVLGNPLSYCDPLGCTITPPMNAELYNQAVEYLKDSQTFRDTFDFVNRSGTKVTVEISTAGYTVHYVNRRGTHVILWDPLSASMTLSGGSQSPAIGLAHELEHIRNRLEGDYVAGVFSDAYLASKWRSQEEFNVISVPELSITQELGEVSRTEHNTIGSYAVGDPTTTWPTDFVKYGKLADEFQKTKYKGKDVPGAW